MRSTILAGALLTALAGAAAAADAPSGPTHWTLAEVKAFEAKLAADPKTSAQNPVLTMMQLGPGQSVRRTSFGKSGEAEIHGNTVDVFCVLTGEAEFVLGGEIIAPRTTNPGEIRGASIKGGASKTVAAGDILIVPAGTAHQILLQPGRRVSFMVAKFAK